MRSLSLLLLLAATATTPLAAKPADYAPAVATPGRPADAVALDAVRKPAEVLDFEQLKPGMKVLDFLTGTGYYAEIMGRVVGPKGSVTAYSPATYNPEPIKAAFAAMAPRAPNVTLVSDPRTAFFPGGYDFVMIHLNYHDLYWESEQYHIPRTDPNFVLGALFRATKPGGIVAVIDHAGPAGDTRQVVDKLHRIDPETVKVDFQRAGFVLEAQSDVLRVAEDDHTKNVFDPAVRGKTDRFTFRFRKPK